MRVRVVFLTAATDHIVIGPAGLFGKETTLAGENSILDFLRIAVRVIHRTKAREAGR